MGGLISFVIQVDNIDEVLGLYDHIQVFKAPAIDGTYENITAPVATAATLVGSVPGSWSLSGKTLTLVLNGADPLDILFNGSDPFALDEVITQLNVAVPDLASESDSNTNKLRLTSALLGTGSSIMVSGDARPVFGFPANKVNGSNPSPLLSKTTTIYKFTDFDGENTDYYKYRFSSFLTGRVSEFSNPQQGDAVPVLSSGHLSKAVINLVTLQGIPVVGRRIIFVPMSNMIIPQTNFSVLPGFDRVFAVTDNRGHAEIDLVIGARVKVFIEGSQFFREIIVPPDSTFDLLALMAESPDPFAIVQSPPRPIRVS